MNKNGFENKRLYLILGRTLSLFAIIAGVYVFGYLGPKYRVFRALAEAEERLMYRREALLENQLAIFELAGLNSGSAGFAITKDRLFEIVSKTRDEAIRRVNESKPLTKIPGLTGKSEEMYNSDLVSFDRDVRISQVAILEEQERVLAKLVEIDTAGGKLLGYVPEKDLGGLNLDKSEAKEELGVRIEAAGEGVRLAVEKISKINGVDEKQLQKVVSKSDILRLNLSDFKEVVLEGGTARSEIARKEIIREFNDLKTLVFELELDCFKAENVVKNLTDEVNLLNRYEYWLKMVRADKLIWFKE